MALSEALRNIAANYRFHASLRGGLAARLGYLTAYYLIFICLRSGDRHLRPLVWLKRSGLSDHLVEVETPEGLCLRLDLHTAFDPLFSILCEGDYVAPPDFAPAPGQVVLDMGANVGTYSILAARRVGPEGAVVAVEPFPANFELLTGNAARNGLGNLRAVRAAGDSSAGEGVLYVHDRCINHSLVRPTGSSVPVRLVTVDSLLGELGLGRLDLVKIDTEGTAARVLRGARESLRRYRPRVAYEHDNTADGDEAGAVLRELGYALERVRTIVYARPS